MGIDKLKIASRIKLCVLIFYLLYFIFFNAGLNAHLPSFKNNDTSIKENLIRDSCLLIVGGSNVRQGISAQLLSENICSTLNLGVINEMGSFNSYQNWLAKNLNSKNYNYVLYSTKNLWDDKLIIEKKSDLIEFPSASIFAQLKNAFIDNKLIFNSRGDIEHYNCNLGIASFNFNENDFSSSNAIVAQEIKRRVSRLANTTSTNNVYLRIPPVYVKTKRQAEIYTELMNERIRIIERLGIKIIDTTLVSTDASLFCDSFHPNAKGREVFTKEIKLPYLMPVMPQ